MGSTKASGDIYYDGDNIKSGKFIVSKIADYIEQGDTHEAILSVKETLKFSWRCTTGGHHSYSRAKDAESAAVLDQQDEHYTLVNNVMTTLGLKGVKETYVGNASIRGVSGGQKRRVTVGEVVVCPRPVSYLCGYMQALLTCTLYIIFPNICID
ncbi:ATP-binding cassette domain-containing protein [archaeon]|nr:MAG: ATP-binding cassette domain-containing protein [archaeon]